MNDVTCLLKRYLESGRNADALKAKYGAGVGFVGGALIVILWNNGQKSKWAVKFFIFEL